MNEKRIEELQKEKGLHRQSFFGVSDVCEDGFLREF